MVGGLVWSTDRAGVLELTEAASFGLLGVSAAAGVAVLPGVAAALVRGARGLPLARLLCVLCWARLGAVTVGVLVLGVWLGLDALRGSLQTFGAVVAVAEAMGTLYITDVAVRRTAAG